MWMLPGSASWRTSLFLWTCLSLLIICSDGLHGQDKQVEGLLLLSHESDSGGNNAHHLLGHSDLSENLETVNKNDILRVRADDDDDDDGTDSFPKKLARQFRKHRWKLSGGDDDNDSSTFISLHRKKTTTPVPIIVPASNRTRIITDLAPLRATVGDYDAVLHNYGQEELFDKITSVMTTTPVNKSNKSSSSILKTTTKTKPEDRFNNNNNDELEIPTDIVKVKSFKATNESQKRKSEDDGGGGDMKKVVDMELFRLNNNDRDDDKFRFHADMRKFGRDGGGEGRGPLAEDNNNNGVERIIPQLVNVTTENVYISIESDEEDLNEDDDHTGGGIYKNHQRNQLVKFGDKLKGIAGSSGKSHNLVTPEASSHEEPSVITVNATGIFPVSNLSSIWESKRKRRKQQEQLTSEGINERNVKEMEIPEEGEEADEDFDDGDGEGKTLMMRRRPRRSVVHLYDMVVCATGCNPLIYKGYGCFCGFMGSGYTVDGIDKCCYKHDWCYHHAKCPPLLTYFVPYYWTCNAGRPKCVTDFRGWKGICGAHLCECDRQFAECLRKYPCPRSRAMCMTSPWSGVGVVTPLRRPGQGYPIIPVEVS